jgi:hypothetical protein
MDVGLKERHWIGTPGGARMAMQRQLTGVGCTFNVPEICVLPVCQSLVHDISHWAVG